MANQSIPPSQALKLAMNALQRGDKHAARVWAQIAASLAPDMEEPWLVLAAVARPHASIAYLERALEINPDSQRAREGLVWAHQQHAHEKTHALKRTILRSSARAELPGPGNSTIRTGKPALQIPPKAIPGMWFSIPLLVLVLAICLIAVWAFWPGAGSSVSAAILGYPGSAQAGHILSWLPVSLGKPTDTPLPTSTSTPTNTPSPTSLPTDTPSPTPVPTEIASPTLIPTATPLPTNTLMPTNTPPPDDQAAAAQQPSAGGKKRIVVSIHEQHLYAYEDDTLVYSFVASTGSGNSTRTGTFSILDKIPKAYGETWNFWMPDWMGIYYVGSMEDGIHSLPLLNNGQRLWGDAIGTPITYGCVVLDIQDSKTLYNWADIGTTVQINR